MKRITSSFLVVALLLLGCQASVVTPEKNYNIVFILVDDLGAKDLSCYGSEFYETPHLDKFAKAATRFSRAYASSPVCSPTRGAILTGRCPPRINITDWIPGQSGKSLHHKLITPEDLHELPLKEKTFVEVFKDKGYKTFFAGKWHLGSEGFLPEQQGFDTNKGGHHKGSPPGGYYAPYKNPKLTSGPRGEYLTDRLTDESIKFMEDNKGDPFVLYLAFYTVHTPIQACKRYLPRFQDKLKKHKPPEQAATVAEHKGFTRQHQNRAAYASMVYAMDHNVGRLLSKLDELKLSDNTIVVFTSDNGGLSTLHHKRGGPTSNYPLRAGKGWCYEGGIRIPTLIHVPGVPASVSDVPVISTDFFPTLLELTGHSQMPGLHRDGVSLLPLINGEKKIGRDTLYWHYPHYHGSAWTPGAAIRHKDWKLIEFYETDTIELYNLADDEGERKDLSKSNPDQAKKLHQMLKNWQKSVGARLPTKN